MQVRPGTAPYSLYWFNVCGRIEGDASASYLIEGTVTFEDLEVIRADAVPQPLGEFIADGQRQWQAFFGHDERLSGEAQQAAQNGTPSWRPYVHSPGQAADPSRRPQRACDPGVPDVLIACQTRGGSSSGNGSTG